MNTALTQLNVTPQSEVMSRPAGGAHLDGLLGCEGRPRSGIPTGNAAYWATLRPVQSTRVSRQGWRTLLDVLRNPDSR